jgi:hypothetical protein
MATVTSADGLFSQLRKMTAEGKRHQDSLPHKNKSQSCSKVKTKNATFCTAFLFQADAHSRRDAFAW